MQIDRKTASDLRSLPFPGKSQQSYLYTCPSLGCCNKIHPGGFNNRHLFFDSSGGCKFKVRVSAWRDLVTALFWVIDSSLLKCPHLVDKSLVSLLLRTLIQP